MRCWASLLGVFAVAAASPLSSVTDAPVEQTLAEMDRVLDRELELLQGQSAGGSLRTTSSQSRFRSSNTAATKASSKRKGPTKAIDKTPKPDLFKNVWPDAQKKKAIDLYFHLDKVAKKHNVDRPGLFYGTALGALRNKAIIPWDDDLDCLMMEDAFNKIKAELSKEDPRFAVVGNSKDRYYKLYYAADMPDRTHKLAWSWPFLDIFLARVSGKDCKVDTGQEIETFLAADIFPLVECPWENTTALCPANNKGILDKEYPGWDSECDSGGYDHKNEKGRAESQKVKCSTLSSIYDVAAWNIKSGYQEDVKA